MAIEPSPAPSTDPLVEAAVKLATASAFMTIARESAIEAAEVIASAFDDAPETVDRLRIAADCARWGSRQLEDARKFLAQRAAEEIMRGAGA